MLSVRLTTYMAPVQSTDATSSWVQEGVMTTGRSAPISPDAETGATIISSPPPESAHTNEYVEKALDELRDEGADVEGADWQPIDVTLNEGGS